MANALDAYVPEWWANGTLAILYENMVALGLVNRDYEDQFQQYGDIVNTRRPTEFHAVRKAKASPITTQNAQATNIQIPLDQHIHTSFNINDIEASYSFKDLMREFISPAGMALARAADRVVLGQAARWIEDARMVGGRRLDPYDSLIDGSTLLSNQKAPDEGRNVIMSPSSQGKLLKNRDIFPVVPISKEFIRKGYLGPIANFETYKAQNVMDVTLPDISGIVSSGELSAASKGATVLNMSTVAATPAAAVGQSIIIDGAPYIITAAATPAITVSPGLINDIPAATPFHLIVKAKIGANYATGWVEEMLFLTGAGIYTISVGVMLKIGSVYYTVIDSGIAAGTWLLDRPLESAVSTNDLVNAFAGIQTNFAFCRNALTAAIRPLAPVPPGMGARSGYSSWGGLTVRATLSYDSTYQNTKVTLDFLMGVKVLDLNQGAVIFT